MSQEGFNWKSLFVNENKDASAPQTTPNSPQPDNSKFPMQSHESTPADASSNPFISEIWDVYEKGFESLNSTEFDFFELYKSVMVVGVTNQQSYQMAFTMGKALKPDLSKQFLLDKAKYYIDEIEKVYAKYDSIGNTKKAALNNGITKDKETMTQAIKELESKITQLQYDLQKKKEEFEKIDANSKETFTEIQLKLEANNIARQKILTSINQVVTGINQYL
jgi:hypothetical protein